MFYPLNKCYCNSAEGRLLRGCVNLQHERKMCYTHAGGKFRESLYGLHLRGFFMLALKPICADDSSCLRAPFGPMLPSGRWNVWRNQPPATPGHWVVWRGTAGQNRFRWLVPAVVVESGRISWSRTAGPSQLGSVAWRPVRREHALKILLFSNVKKSCEILKLDLMVTVFLRLVNSSE